MPRYAHAQLRWSEQAQVYIFSVGDEIVEQALMGEWLERHASFAFHGRSRMHYTVRKQQAQRGSGYWYSYRRVNGRLVKRYIGRTAEVTYPRLEEIAQQLESIVEAGSETISPVDEMFQAATVAATLEASDREQRISEQELPLLLAKLTAPRPRAGLLDRPRLLRLLDAGRESQFMLLSGPAGSGKTTLISQWLAARRERQDLPPVGWVSLEQTDNDPLRFWRYVIAACESLGIDLAQVRRALTELIPQPPFWPSSLEKVLTILLNTLTQHEVRGIVVLEDYSAITSLEIHAMLAFVLEHLPATLQLVLLTRRDPPFSLARLRARGVLYEVRASDLNFTLDETSGLFQQALSFPLADETIEQLHMQLEGWGVGLHLTKLALQRTTVVRGEALKLAQLPQRGIALREYFVSEVLEQQGEAVQQFLLKTSLFPRLTGGLCDAVTGQHNSRDMLVSLEHMNMFLEPLDDIGKWYRYHTLFADALRDEARRHLGEEEVRQVFVRASLWYEAQGYSDEAIEASLEAQEYVRAVGLLERFIAERGPSSGEIREPYALRRWIERLPEVVLWQRPVLCLSYAIAVLFAGGSWLPDAATRRLLEKLLCEAERCWRQEHNEPQLGTLQALRSLLALRQGDMQAALVYAREALDRLGETQKIWRGLCLCMVADEWIEKGHLQLAYTALQEAQAVCKAAGNSYFERVATVKLAQVCFEQGEWQRASVLYRRVLTAARVAEHMYVVCHALTGLAIVQYQRNELELAYSYAQEVISLSQSSHLIYYKVAASLILARVQHAQGQMFVAQQQLTDLLDKVPGDLPDLVQDVQADLARLALASGDYASFQRWILEHKPQQNVVREIATELLASRWLRVQGKLAEAERQLHYVLARTKQIGSTRLLLEVQVEVVLVMIAGRRKVEAQALLREVLAQAMEEPAIRLFLEAGEQMEMALRSLIPQIEEPSLVAYVRTLLNAFPELQRSEMVGTASFIEALSPQELRVLRLLAQHHSNADIANNLVVSVNTVRTQIQSIYRKLDVHSRQAASERARELRLL